VKRRGPLRVSAASRALATNPLRRRTALDIDDQGKVLGLVDGPIDAIPKRGDLEKIADDLADLVTAPIDIIMGIVGKLEGLPKAALVGYVLFRVTRSEFARNRRRT
jgi:hypothetical protein